MFKNIFFIGGIHGVGKSTICQQVCREMNIEYLSASELLKWGEINDDVKNKNVEDITYTKSVNNGLI
jgi:adenylate kinase